MMWSRKIYEKYNKHIGKYMKNVENGCWACRPPDPPCDLGACRPQTPCDTSPSSSCGSVFLSRSASPVVVVYS